MTDDVASGLANERTMLAWTRTALAYLTVGALAAKVLPDDVSVVARMALAGLAAVLGALAWLYSYSRYRAYDAAVAAGRGPDGSHALRALSLGTVAFAVASAAVELS